MSLRHQKKQQILKERRQKLHRVEREKIDPAFEIKSCVDLDRIFDHLIPLYREQDESVLTFLKQIDDLSWDCENFVARPDNIPFWMISHVKSYQTLFTLCSMQSSEGKLAKKVSKLSFSILKNILYAEGAGVFLLSQCFPFVLPIFKSELSACDFDGPLTKARWKRLANFMNIFNLVLADRQDLA